MKKESKFIIFAIFAAALYAISTPVSKLLLENVPPTMVAAFLYLGAGIGMGVSEGRISCCPLSFYQTWAAGSGMPM